jgi:hypothetical protein
MVSSQQAKTFKVSSVLCRGSYGMISWWLADTFRTRSRRVVQSMLNSLGKATENHSQTLGFTAGSPLEFEENDYTQLASAMTGVAGERCTSPSFFPTALIFPTTVQQRRN